MAKDYSSYGNFKSTSKPVNTNKSVPKGWVNYIDPFFGLTNNPLPPDWRTVRTIQPIFDFSKDESELYHITFVVQFEGFDGEIKLEQPDNNGNHYRKGGWYVSFDLRVQHESNSGITAMRKARNSAGLKRIYSALRKDSFFQKLAKVVPSLEIFSSSGNIEEYGSGYRLGRMIFKAKDFHSISHNIYDLCNYITNFDYSEDLFEVIDVSDNQMENPPIRFSPNNRVLL